MRNNDIDMLDGLANSLVSDELSALRTWSIKSQSSGGPENTVRKQIGSVQAVLEDVVVQIFTDARVAKESALDTKVVSVRPTVVRRLFARDFQSAVYLTLV